MAQIRQPFGWGHDTGNQFANAEERVLQNQARNIAPGLVLRHQPDSHGPSQALSIHNDLVIPRLGAIAQIIQRGLGVDVQARLVRGTGRDAVPPVLQHEDVAAGCRNQHAGDGQAVADVAGVAVEHEYRHLGVGAAARPADVEGGQLLAIVRRDDELLVVFEVVLAGARHIGARVGRDMRGVDEGSAQRGQLSLPSQIGGLSRGILLLKVEQGSQTRSNPLRQGSC